MGAGYVVYEMRYRHASTWKVPPGQRVSPYLAELGVTVIEVMPVAQFAASAASCCDGVLGRFTRAAFCPYGTPDDFAKSVY
ncbi:hypothetical protein KCP75_07500 [Salmonella enterica subsp. enterica]|nr:hypothetical protein KCP75_07500 [Salmonella enterica subsp. enterica]